jgi:hypothetical protein
MFPEYDGLHQEKIAHCRDRDGAELRNENILSERCKANHYYDHCDQPVVQDHDAVVKELFEVVTAAAPKDPELIQQEMATDSDKIGERYRKQRREKATKKRNPAAIDNGNAGSYGYKAHES